MWCGSECSYLPATSASVASAAAAESVLLSFLARRLSPATHTPPPPHTHETQTHTPQADQLPPHHLCNPQCGPRELVGKLLGWAVGRELEKCCKRAGKERKGGRRVTGTQSCCLWWVRAFCGVVQGVVEARVATQQEWSACGFAARILLL